MKITVAVSVESDDDTLTATREAFSFERGSLACDTLGLGIDESKDLLAAIQATVVDEQVRSALAARQACSDYGRAHRHKDTRNIVVRRVFGTLRLASLPLVALPVHRP